MPLREIRNYGVINDLPETFVSKTVSGRISGFLQCEAVAPNGNMILKLHSSGDTYYRGFASVTDEGLVRNHIIPMSYYTDVFFINGGNQIIVSSSEGKLGLFSTKGEKLIGCDCRDLFYSFSDDCYYGSKGRQSKSIRYKFDKEYNPVKLKYGEIDEVLTRRNSFCMSDDEIVKEFSLDDGLFVEDGIEYYAVFDKDTRLAGKIQVSEFQKHLGKNPKSCTVLFCYGGFSAIVPKLNVKPVIFNFNGANISASDLEEKTGIKFDFKQNENSFILSNKLTQVNYSNLDKKLDCSITDLDSIFLDVMDFGNGILIIRGKKYLSLQRPALEDYLKKSIDTKGGYPLTLSKLRSFGFNEISSETKDTVEVSGKVFKKKILKI